MDFSEIFGPDVSVRDFFFEMIPRIHAARGEEYGFYSDESIIFSVFLQDTNERYTAEVTPDGVELEDDEMIDFPLVTIIGYDKYWPTVRDHASRLATELDSRRHEFREQFKVTRAFLDDFERYDVAIDLRIVSEDEAVEMTLVLNNYEDAKTNRRFGVEIPLSLIESVASAETSIESAGRSLRITGDMRLAANLGGLFLTHAPQ